MASIPTKTFYSTRPRLSLSKAEAILEAIASQDNSDLDLSDDELNETSIQVPQPDVSSSDDSDEQDSDSEPSTSMGKFPPWRHAPFVSSLPDIPDTPDGEPDSRTNWNALDYFKQYFSEEFYRNMHEMTEVGYPQRKGTLLNSNAAEMKNFIGATFMMSCLGYPQIRLYWARQTRVAAIADVLTRDRFFLLRKNIKVVNDLEISDEKKKADRLWRLRPFIEMIRTACLQLPRSPSASIDEQIIPFTGRTTLVHVPDKPHPTGLKNFVLSSPSGMVLDFEIYQGKSALTANRSELGVGACAVLRLSKSMPTGSSSFFDRYFTSAPLLRHLSSQGLRGTGTIMKNRLPKDSKLPDDKALVKKGRGSFCQTVNVPDGICLVKWVDNKTITFASSHIGEEPVGECKRWCKKERVYKDVSQPAIVEEYNKNMGGVDLCDRMVSLYPSKARTTRWTVRALSFLADVTVVNAWLQYKEDCQLLRIASKNTLSLLDFKLLIAHHLLRAELDVGEDDDEPPPKRPASKITPLPPASFRTAGATHMPELSSQKSASRCRNPLCSERTKFRCTRCDIFLCITSRNCFKQFHT